MPVRNFMGNQINYGSLLEGDKSIYIDTFTKPDGNDYEEMKNFHQLVKKKKCLLDVGCAYGMFSLVFCSHPNKVSHAFDASHLTQLGLTQTLLMNPGKKIYYHKMFLGEKDVVTAYNGEAVHALAVQGNIYDRVVMVQMDTFCSLNKIQPDVIKIDTEGYEYNVLVGGKQVIEAYRPIMFIELHPGFANIYKTYISQVFDFGKEMRYEIKNTSGEKIDLEKIIELKEQSTRTVWYPL